MQDCDPTIFTVYKSKLYLCSTPESMQNFPAREEQNIRKADQIWKHQRPFY